MARWKPILPERVDTAGLPRVWRLQHDPEDDEFVVVGRNRREERPSVVIRVEYASGADNSDLRRTVASIITLGFAKAVRRQITHI